MSHGRKAFGMSKKAAADFHHIKKKKKNLELTPLPVVMHRTFRGIG